MTDTNWTTRPYHRDWLMAKANALFDLFQHNAVNPQGGFLDLDAAGKPYGNLRQIHADGPHGALLRHRREARPAGRRYHRRPRHALPVGRPPRPEVRRLLLVARR